MSPSQFCLPCRIHVQQNKNQMDSRPPRSIRGVCGSPWWSREGNTKSNTEANGLRRLDHLSCQKPSAEIQKCKVQA
nr:hypothetical protein GOBAR_DD27907 [Ipomoea batatas]